jgi:pyruvate,water dikinase
MNDHWIINSNDSSIDSQKVGKKAFHLFKLGQANLAIPPWVCLSTDCYDFYVKNIVPLIKRSLENIDLNNLNDLKRLSEEIKHLFMRIDLSLDLTKLNLKGETFAVRSSALGEDGESYSFAGQLSSFLYVPENRLVESIKKCWASAYNERVLQYLTVNKKCPFLKVAVLIQEMIEGTKSGVLFTANPLLPLNKNREMLITAGYGIGEGIVTDLVETDTYTLQKDQVKVEPSLKKVQLVKGSHLEGGTQLIPVPLALQKVPVLDQNYLSQLSMLGEKIEKLFSCPQDIEWVIDKKGSLFITQARPITTLKKEVKHLAFFDNSNIVESFPGVNTPLTISVVKVVYKSVFYNAMKTMGVSERKLNSKKEVFDSLLGLHQGRAFYNLTRWYEMMRWVPFMESYIKVWEESLGIEKNNNSWAKKEKKGLIVQFYSALHIFTRMGGFFLFLDFILKKLNRELEELFSDFWEKERKVEGKFSSVECLFILEDFQGNIFKKWEYTLYNDIFAFSFSALSKKLLKKWNIKNSEQIFNDLLCGQDEMESVAPIKSILGLVTRIKEVPCLKDELIRQIEGEGKISFSDPFFMTLFQNHLSLYGDRGVEELKLETISFRERPQGLVRMIIEFLETDLSFKKMGRKDLEAQKSAWKEIHKNLSFFKRLLFKGIFLLAKRSIVYRENFRLHRSRAYGVLRRLFKIMGKDLEQRGILEKERDIFFLQLNEIADILKGKSFNRDLKEPIRKRKVQFSLFKTMKTEGKYWFDGFNFSSVYNSQKSKKRGGVLKGRPCSSGRIKGEVLVIHDLKDVEKNASLVKGKILVAPMTDPGWVYLMNLSAGLIVEKGSILSHTAIIGRELGIPTIVTVPEATSILKTGDFVRMDGQTGQIFLENN